jgi:hypothetical protein
MGCSIGPSVGMAEVSWGYQNDHGAISSVTNGKRTTVHMIVQHFLGGGTHNVVIAGATGDWPALNGAAVAATTVDSNTFTLPIGFGSLSEAGVEGLAGNYPVTVIYSNHVSIAVNTTGFPAFSGELHRPLAELSAGLLYAASKRDERDSGLADRPRIAGRQP